VPVILDNKISRNLTVVFKYHYRSSFYLLYAVDYRDGWSATQFCNPQSWIKGPSANVAICGFAICVPNFLGDITSGNLQKKNFLLKNTALRGLSHEMDLAFDVVYCMVISRPKEVTGPFLNFLIAPMLLRRKKYIS
jgi:hypothetical protein